MNTTEKTFDSTPCFIELMGHNKLSARVTESFQGMLRCDVPATSTTTAFTKFINPSSCYGITIVSEETMQALAENYRVKPLQIWDMREAISKFQLPQANTEEETNEEEE